MSKLQIIFISVLLTLLGACDAQDEATSVEDFDAAALELDLQDTEPTVGTAPGEGSALALAGGGPDATPFALVISDCPGAKRLIGMLSSGNDCSMGGSLPNDWSGAPLFEAGSPGVAALTDMPAHFGRYCVFDYVGAKLEIESSDYNPLFGAIEASPYMSRDTVSADCRGEFSQGSGLYDAGVGQELHTSFMTNIDWENGAQTASDPSARAPVEIAVLDTLSQTVADTPGLTPADAHGHQISALIQRVNCPTADSACLARLRNIMAMPREDWTKAPDWTKGGHHGTQGDLALAIYEAVHDWRQRRASDPVHAPKRLVVNLSLGWDRLDGIANQLTRGPAAALVDAMKYVNCQGGVIIVSAGNVADQRCPSDSSGPLDPASFETMAAPTAIECAALGALPLDTINYPVFALPGSYEPLVHAVGALDEHDRELINMRPEAMPRLAALGANGIVDTDAEALAGTSVSAAVVSATAALVWSYRPELRASELMELIHSSGWSTGEHADFHYANGQQPVRRVSVCAALDAACSGQGNSCPVAGCSATAPAEDGHLIAVADAVDLVLSDPATATAEYSGSIPETITCGEPQTQPEQGANNLSSPQPELPICSRCNLTKPPGFEAGDDQLSMTIAAAYAGHILDVHLITVDEEGVRTSRRMRAEVVASLNGQPDTVDVTRVLLEAGNAVAAGLEFVLEDGSRQSNRIPVITR